MRTFVFIVIMTFALACVRSAHAQERDRDENFRRATMSLTKNHMLTFGSEGRYNTIPVRKLVAKDSTLIVVGFDRDENPEWVYIENAQATMRFADMNFDGLVDRIILNKEALKPHHGEHSTWNDLKTFATFTTLRSEAKISASVQPESVYVYAITYGTDGQAQLNGLDFTTGTEEVAQDDKAREYVATINSKYIDWLLRAK